MTAYEKEFLEPEQEVPRFTNNCGIPVVLQEWHFVLH